jgi:hypothetical protein
MNPLIAAAIEEAEALVATRGWQLPSDATVREAELVLELTHARWPPPALLVDADGAITFEWDVGTRGWVELRVDGSGQLSHSAVIQGDDYAQSEDLTEPALAGRLPDWAAEVLRRLYLPLQ